MLEEDSQDNRLPERPSSLPDRCNQSTRSFSERRAPTQASAVITPARDSFIIRVRSLKGNLAQRHLREATDSASGVVSLSGHRTEALDSVLQPG